MTLSAAERKVQSGFAGAFNNPPNARYSWTPRNKRPISFSLAKRDKVCRTVLWLLGSKKSFGVNTKSGGIFGSPVGTLSEISSWH
jgi:hypothetical protein